MWFIDYTGLVRKHGKIYILKDEAIITELLKINHNDFW